MADIDERGSFYLGRVHDVASGLTLDAPLVYDSSDLTTHAVCVGMTGSGKTGLGIALLEEAALDGVPAIAIDPKGDLGNLLLTFPDLRGSDFRPWVDESAAAREGLTVEALADRTAEKWQEGLASWGEDGERIRRFRDAADCAIYTPGSTAGLPLTVLKSFNAPPSAVRDDAEAFGDHVQAAASGVLALLGVDADPVNSREHILLSKVLESAWRAGRDLDLGSIIRDVQAPPFPMVGAVPLDSFLAPKDRDALAMRLNNLLASPAFANWLSGEPLDVARLLRTADGRPRLSILSIAHLGDEERMFFVTLLLNEVLSWLRSQPGSSSLRAILYMDEIFGFFPPSANPPAKRPMLTLLKQARAYGLGCVLATQNPVDLDYKGLSNAGTWFLGRLQTERDKLRVLDGLEGASAEAGAKFDRGELERTLAGLGKRVFLLNNVHDSAPKVFQTRWALSYLAGPLTRQQIATLMAPRKATTALDRAVDATPAPAAAASAAGGRPLLSSDVPQKYWLVDVSPSQEAPITYRPALLGLGRLHFVQSAEKLDVWRAYAVLRAVDSEPSQSPWDDATVLTDKPQLADEPRADATFASVPASLGEAKSFQRLRRELGDWLYQTQRFVQFTCAELGASSDGDESEAAFRVRVAPLLQAKRKTLAVQRRGDEKAKLQQELEKAEQQRSEHRWWFLSLLFNMAARFAEIVITGLVGRRSRKQLVTTGLWNQAMKSRRLAGQAKKVIKEKSAALVKLEASEQHELRQLDAPLSPAAVPLTKRDVAPRKGDVDVDQVLLAWLPWSMPAGAPPMPAFAPPRTTTTVSSVS